MGKRQKNRRKQLDNTGRSERSKYLDTMMADMGITSLQDLSSDEERNRWIKAVSPQPIVEKRLREMGYDMTGRMNKRSLGSRKRAHKLFSFYKKANALLLGQEVTAALIDIRSVVTPDTSYAILEIINKPNMMQSPDFSATNLKADLDAAIAASEDSPAEFQHYVQNLVDKITKYNSGVQSDAEAEATTDYNAMRQYFMSTSGINIRRGHEDRDQVRFIQNKLETLGYTLNRLGANGEFGEETEAAILLFQEHNNIPRTGHVDDAMINRLFASPTPMPTGTRREHRRMVRQEQRGLSPSSPNAEQPSGSPAPAFQNISYTSARVDIAGASPMLREYLGILNQAAADIGGSIQITSAFRDSYNQSRIMYNNYTSRGVGSDRAGRYLRGLYRRYQRVGDIVAIFAGNQAEEAKIRAVEGIIESSWLPKTSHRAGLSIDVRLGGKVRNILEATQDLATVDILRESDHFHVTVKSLVPGGIPRGKVRGFNA